MKKYLILFIVALLTTSTEVFCAAPITTVQADSIKIFKKLNKKYERQKKERRKVASLFRDLLEVKKFQFEAYVCSYRGAHKESTMTLKGYGADLWVTNYDLSNQSVFFEDDSFIPPTINDFLNLKNNRRYTLVDRSDNWYFSNADYTLSNVREEGDNLLFDINVNTPIRTPQYRLCNKSKLEFYADIYSGLIVMRVLFLNDQGDTIEHGPRYSGYLNVLR